MGSKPDWPANSIHQRDISELVPYARNARTHSEGQVAQIAASMKEWGWTNPVLIDEAGGIIAGHGRVLAARQLGISKIPCMIASGWSEAQKRAYVLADNQLALNAGWDNDLLKIEIGELASENFDVGLIGFEDGFLAGLMNDGAAGLTDPDETPEPPEDPVTHPGDVWVLGKHRLVCGDCTDADVVSKCLNGVEPHLMVTDPPYGVEYDADWRNRRILDNGKPVPGRAVGKVQNDNRADWREAWALFPGDVAYVWCASLQSHVVAQIIIESGYDLRSLIIWNKGQFTISRGNYHWKHEPCWYAVKKNRKGHYSGDRKQTTVWEIANAGAVAGNGEKQTGHSTQKPVECMRRPIVNNSSPGQAVYEPFSGSGTTIIAAEMEGRACHAIELNPAYVDVAVKRWQDFTGQKAVNETDNARTI